MTSAILTRCGFLVLLSCMGLYLGIRYGKSFTARVGRLAQFVTCLIGTPVAVLFVAVWVCGGIEGVADAFRAVYQTGSRILADLPLPLENWLESL